MWTSITNSSESESDEDSNANSDGTENDKNYDAWECMEVDNPKETEKEKDNNATAKQIEVVDIDLEPQETENNATNEDILRMDAYEYKEFVGELVNYESNLDLLDEDEPVVAKD